MKTQEKNYLDFEANDWFERNSGAILNHEEKPEFKKLLKSKNRVIETIKECLISPKIVLELGGSNGYVLSEIQKEFQCKVYEIEPSSLAVEDGKKRFPNINIRQGVASDLSSFEDGFFDFVLIKGVFCWIARETLLKSVSEIDRALKDKGHLTIIDYFVERPIMNRNTHVKNEEIYCFKIDYSEIFTATRIYSNLYKKIFPDPQSEYKGENREFISVLKKSLHGNYIKND